jgi:ABC-type antimicrobial peptide transport system permease subunit
MKSVKYALRNVFRLFRSTLLLFSVIFILSALGVTALCVKNGATGEYSRLGREYETYVSITNKTENKSGAFTTRGKSLFKEDMDYIISSPYTKGYTLQLYTDISAENNFLLYDRLYSYRELQNDSFFTEENKTVFHDYRIMGIEKLEFLRNIKLSEGRTFTAEEYENGGDAVILQKEFAEEKDYKVGDSLFIGSLGKETLEWNKVWDGINGVRDDIFELKVVGIYETPITSLYNYTSILYIPLETAYKYKDIMYSSLYWDMIRSTPNNYDPFVSLTGIEFLIDSPENSDEFIKYIADNGFDVQNFDIIAMDSDYKFMTKPLLAIMSMTDILLKAVGIASVAIIIFVMFLIIRSRKKEIGLLRALGCLKKTIAFRFVAEMLFTAVLALLAGCFAGAAISDAIAERVLEDKVTQYKAVMSEENADLIYGDRSEDIFEQLSIKLKLNAKLGDIITVAASALAVILISNCICIMYISRVEPVIILSGT